MAAERARGLAGQFVMDTHTHFLQATTRASPASCACARRSARAGWNPGLAGRPQTIEDLKFDNYFKEIFLDSDTKVALISSAPSDVRGRLVPHQSDDGAGARPRERAPRRPAHAEPRDLHAGPARMDGGGRARDRRGQARLVQGLHHRRQHPQGPEPASVAARRREAALSVLREDGEGRASSTSASTRGSSRRRSTSSIPTCAPTATCATWARPRRTGRSSTSSSITAPIVSRAAASPTTRCAQFEQTGRVEWVTDLAEIPAKYGVTNVYADLGQLFALTTVAQPRLTAAIMGTLVSGMGARPRHLGHRRGVDRRAAMADRRAAPARDPGGHAAQARLRRRSGPPTDR